MVDTLEPYQKTLKDTIEDLPKILRDILVKRKEDVIEIIKDNQLSKGLGPDGALLGTYSRYTEIESLKTNPRRPKREGEHYNFEWTGDYFDAFDIKFEDNESFSLFSRDSKAEELNKLYGDLETLTETNNKRVNKEILLPEMYEEIIRRLFI